MGISGENMKKMFNSNQLNLKDGEIQLFDFDMLMMPVYTFTALLELISERCDEDEVFDMLFEIGKRHGQYAIDEIGKVNEMPKKRFIEQAIYTGDVLGMGHLSYEKLDFKAGKLVFKIEDSPLAEHFQNSEALSDLDRTIDEFHRGIFHKIGEVTLEGEVESTETHCNYLSDDYCRIVVEKINT